MQEEKGWRALVPEPRHDAVRAALVAAFGTDEFAEAQRLGSGVSGAAMVRGSVRGRSYALRVEPERIALRDRERHFACLAAAAATGAAPPVRYADAAAGVSITDFVAGRPLQDHPDGAAGCMRALGAMLRRVQASTPYPIEGDSYTMIIRRSLDQLKGSDRFPAGALDRHEEALARIAAVLPWDASALVGAHNDPNPRNLLFDGERMWLIDWELGFPNDPLVDIAIVATDLAGTPELEDLLLTAALGRTPDVALRARLAIIRLLTRLFYGCIVLDSLATMPGGGQDPNLDALTPAGFRAAVAAGRFASGSPEVAYAFGKMSLRAFLDGTLTPEFAFSLRRLRGG